MRIAALALLACLSCGSGGGPQAPTKCDPSTEIVGKYLVHWDIESGNCGPIPDKLETIEPGGAMGTGTGGCQVSTSVFSDGNCRVDYVETCPTATGNTGIRLCGKLNDASPDPRR